MLKDKDSLALSFKCPYCKRYTKLMYKGIMQFPNGYDFEIECKYCSKKYTYYISGRVY